MIINIVNILFDVLKFAILIEVLLTWIPDARYSKIGSIVRSFTAPVMEPSEKLNDMIFSGLPISFSPIIAYFIIAVIQRIIIGLLYFLF